MITLKYNSSKKYTEDRKSGYCPDDGRWIRDIYTDVLVREDSNLQSDEVQRGIADQICQFILPFGGWYVNHSHVLRSPGGKEVLVLQAFSTQHPNQQCIIISVRME